MNWDSNAERDSLGNQLMKGFRTPSWFRAKRNVELKQAKAKISEPKTGKRKKRK